MSPERSSRSISSPGTDDRSRVHEADPILTFRVPFDLRTNETVRPELSRLAGPTYNDLRSRLLEKLNDACQASQSKIDISSSSQAKTKALRDATFIGGVASVVMGFILDTPKFAAQDFSALGSLGLVSLGLGAWTLSAIVALRFNSGENLLQKRIHDYDQQQNAINCKLATFDLAIRDVSLINFRLIAGVCALCTDNLKTRQSALEGLYALPDAPRDMHPSEALRGSLRMITNELKQLLHGKDIPDISQMRRLASDAALIQVALQNGLEQWVDRFNLD